MKKITIQNAIWNIAMKTIKGTLAIDLSRPVLRKCKIEVDEKFIKFISIDGYSGTIYTYEHKEENVEKFDFLVDCFLVDVDKNWINRITIEKDEDYVKFSYVDNNKNIIERIIENCEWEYINYKNIFADKDSEDAIKILVDVNKLKRVLNSYSGNCKNVRLVISKEKNKPIFFENDEMVTGLIESILLPMREFEEE